MTSRRKNCKFVYYKGYNNNLIHFSSRHSKKTHHAKLLLETRDSTPLSVGYHDETESTESESGTELLEDAETLRDEGVEVTRGKYATKPVRIHSSEIV